MNYFMGELIIHREELDAHFNQPQHQKQIRMYNFHAS